MLAKLARGDERDWAFVETSLRQELVEPRILRDRSQGMPVPFRVVGVERLEGVITRAGAGL